MGIIIAAIITALAVVAVYGFVVVKLSAKADRRLLLLAALIALPLQPLAFYFVRLPLDGLLRAVIGTGAAYGWLATLYAPLTEEPAKWLVLAVPAVRKVLRPDSAIPLAMAIGLGFGVGEIGFLAANIAQVPDY